MRKLFALQHSGKWWVSSDRLSGYAHITGEGPTLPAAYLDYMRKFERIVERNKADKAEEQRCVDTIIKMQKKKLGQTPEMDLLPKEFYKPSKRWWQFWK